MLKRNTILDGSFLLVAGLVGFYLLAVGQAAEDFSLLWALLGFFLVFGSVCGILALIIAQFPKGMNSKAAQDWEHVRRQGKWKYVRNLVLPIALPIVVFTWLPVFLSSAERQISFSEEVRNFIVLDLVLIGGMILLAITFWNDSERMYASHHSRTSEKESSKENPQ